MPLMSHNRSTAVTLAIIIFFFATGPRSLMAKEWVSAEGRFRVNADLVGFDGGSVKLATTDGRNIDVAVEELSVDDREFLWTQVSDPKFAATLPKAVVDFKKSMEEMRPIEIKRVEDRLEKLRSELRAGSRQMNHPIAMQAKALVQQLAQRLTMLKSGKPYTPKLSPKDFRVGQVGTLDDDLLFGSGAS